MRTVKLGPDWKHILLASDLDLFLRQHMRFQSARKCSGARQRFLRGKLVKAGRFYLGTTAPATLLILAPEVTLGQSMRNANISDWKAHEPVPSEVQKAEQTAGTAPTTQQQRATDRELETLYRSLMKAPYPDPLYSTTDPLAAASPKTGSRAGKARVSASQQD